MQPTNAAHRLTLVRRPLEHRTSNLRIELPHVPSDVSASVPKTSLAGHLPKRPRIIKPKPELSFDRVAIKTLELARVTHPESLKKPKPMLNSLECSKRIQEEQRQRRKVSWLGQLPVHRLTVTEKTLVPIRVKALFHQTF